MRRYKGSVIGTLGSIFSACLFLFASNAAETSPSASPVAAGTSSNSVADLQRLMHEEIVVTAQKRPERLQDVPVPVTAISGQSLLDNNQLHLQDYYATVPGLTMMPYDLNGAAALAIRGVTTGGFTNPTVGITVDDVPYGSSTGVGIGTVALDLDPSDLERVEVLRGPQGTLYGSSSIGGLLKYVTVDPSTSGWSGRAQVGVSEISHGGQIGYNVREAINIPISDTLALRASAFTRRDPGYIDNVLTGQSDVNKTDVYGGRLSALWRPSDELSLKVSALYQDVRTDGNSNVDRPINGYFGPPTIGDWQQSAVRGTGAGHREIQAYSATLTAKLGNATLTALSGYSVNTLSDSVDYSYYLGGLSQKYFNVAGAVLFDDFKTSKFTQEIRLAVPFGPKIDWLLGLFYTHEDTPNVEHTLAVDPVTGASAGTWNSDPFPTTFMEYAAFSDLTFHFTDRFDVQIGGRESLNRQAYMETVTGERYTLLVFGLPSPVVQPPVHTKDSAFTYLVTPQYKFSPDLMVYARLASGYRVGGPNTASTIFGFPPSFKPDKTQNYEVGAKGDVPGWPLSFDASVYYVDWKDIQLSLTDPKSGFVYFVNGSRAKSQGVELSVQSSPLRGLKVSAWVAWNVAELTKPLPPLAAYGAAGDRLPFGSRFSGNLTFEQNVHVSSELEAFFGGSVSYVGDRKGDFTGSAERTDLPAYATTNLRAGTRYGTWEANLFCNNVADKQGLVGGGLGSIIPYAFQYIQPRTVGLAFSKAF
jgi:iron complex outermembrane receptor protein